MTRNTDTSTVEESSQDSSSRIKSTVFMTNCSSINKSRQDLIYSQLNSLTSSHESNPRNLQHQQIGVIEHQNHMYILYPEKQPVEVDDLDETCLLHPWYKKPLPKQASTPQYRSKNPSKSILRNKIQIENLLMIRSPQPIQCWQILQILDLKGQQWQNLPPLTEIGSEQSSSSMKLT